MKNIGEKGEIYMAENMNEREKKILTTICTALPYMDDFSKGYFLATAEMFAKQEEKKRQERELVQQ